MKNGGVEIWNGLCDTKKSMKTKKLRIEEIIVLGLVGLLVFGWACSSRPVTQPLGPIEAARAEVKELLLEIYEMQLAYRAQYGSFWPTAELGNAANPSAFSPIGIEFSSDTRYTYMFTVANASIFTCLAQYSFMDDDAIVDEWSITERGSLICITDDLRL